MSAAILAVCPSWAPTDASGHGALTAALGDRLAMVGGSVVATDGELVLARVPGAADAVIVALDLQGRLHHACMGLAWGTDVETSRARRLAWRGAPGVRCTEAFRAALGTPPSGVGLWRVPADLEHRLGAEAHEIVDHRGGIAS